MKLRNKKTGDIGELQITEKHCGVVVGNGSASCGVEIYSSLTELNAEWEDYEEPQEYWYIDIDGVVATNAWDFEDNTVKGMRTIGNNFKTREEAEKAVEKLKAWKRLKDKGFRFDGFDVANRGGDNVICGQAYFKAGNYDREEINYDLDICFGGEE